MGVTLALLACLLAALAQPAFAFRSLRQQQGQEGEVGFAAVRTPELAAGLERVPPGAANASLPVLCAETFVRLIGPRFVPFSTADQQAIIAAFSETIVPTLGLIELVTYREVAHNGGDPGLAGLPPAVDLFFKGWLIFNSSYYFEDSRGEWRVRQNYSDRIENDDALGAYADFVARLFGPQGAWGPSEGRIQLLLGIWFPTYLPRRNFALRPLVIVSTNLTVAVQGSGLSAEQASAIALPLEAAVVEGTLGTLVEVISYREASKAGQQLLQLEVTMLMCQESDNTPECEQKVLTGVVGRVTKSEEVLQRWQSAGIPSVKLAGMKQRQPPPGNDASNPATVGRPWLPWHLDRIVQHRLPLDGKFTANATGAVNVYIVSSGVLGDHVEFRRLNGSPGSRVDAAWGFGGLDPLSDCPDASFVGYGMGTLAASLCCGLQAGVAKNASIYSVRFRERCLGETAAFEDGGFPAAMDLVLSAYQPPAVVLLDSWFDPKRLVEGDATNIEGKIKYRLDLLAKANIIVVAGATSSSPCENVIASHPGVIAVGASGIYDEASSARNGSCVDIWAPSGGPGVGLTAASSTGPTDFINTLPRWFGAAAIVVGVAAQYLELHPDASPSQVRQALMNGWVTNHSITSVTSPTSIIFTNFTQSAPAGPPPQPASTTASGLSTGAIVGIAVAAVFGVIFLAALGVVLRRAKRISEDEVSHELLSKEAGWEVCADDIEICTRPDGAQWLLGEGQYGKVHKALIRGVQAVAVRELQQITEQQKPALLKGLPLLKDLSRDANICQFYGACITPGHPVKLVYELMEGGDLHSVLSGERGREFHWNNRGKEVMLDVVRAATFLHDRGCVHSGICSKNVLLSRGWRAKLGDVGLRQLLGLLGQPTRTPALPWTAPELNRGVCTVKSDVFSLGVLLWQLVTLEEPHCADLRPPTVPSECSQQLADAITACTQADPALRPTVKELYTRLLGCPTDGEHLEASVPEPGSQERSRLPTKPSSSTDGLTTHPSSVPRIFNLKSPHMTVIDINSIEFCTDAQGRKQELGSGAFGSVYKVLLDGVQPLAAKVLEIGTDPLVRQAFVREASTLWRLRHKNIVGLSGVAFTPQGQGLLLLELMEGGSLYHALNVDTWRERRFGWYARGRAVACDVAGGLHYLHSMRATHFDLTSANVLFSRGLTAKLADVGLARVMTQTHLSMGKGSDALTGTFPYMAPELLSGCTCTQAVDVYSFGILLWEVCTGVHPVRGKMFKLRVPEDCPQEVADLYAECTSTDPAARPTARQLVQRLQELKKLMREEQPASQPEMPRQGEGREAVPPAARAEDCTANAKQQTAWQADKGSKLPSEQRPPEAVPIASLTSRCPGGAPVVSPFAAMRGYSQF